MKFRILIVLLLLISSTPSAHAGKPSRKTIQKLLGITSENTPTSKPRGASGDVDPGATPHTPRSPGSTDSPGGGRGAGGFDRSPEAKQIDDLVDDIIRTGQPSPRNCFDLIDDPSFLDLVSILKGKYGFDFFDMDLTITDRNLEVPLVGLPGLKRRDIPSVEVTPRGSGNQAAKQVGGYRIDGEHFPPGQQHAFDGPHVHVYPERTVFGRDERTGRWTEKRQKPDGSWEVVGEY